MTASTKKLFLFLLGISLISLLLLAAKWREAGSIVVTPVAEPLVGLEPVPVPTSATDQSLGNPGAPLTVVLYGDLGDPESRRRLRETMAVVARNPQALRLVWKDAPLASRWFPATHYQAHQAAWCAGKQNQYWAFLRLVLDTTTGWREAGLRRAAASLPLDQTAWENCRAGNTAAETIKTAKEAAVAFGIRRIPLMFINNKVINLAPDLNLEQMLGTLIQK